MTTPISHENETDHKRGSKRNEDAVQHRKAVTNFKQSKDIHEDRSIVQSKMAGRKGKSITQKTF